MNKNRFKKRFRKFIPPLLLVFVLVVFLPPILIRSLKSDLNRTNEFHTEFPTTVDPINKTIIESEEINAYLEKNNLPLNAAVILSTKGIKELYWSFINSFARVIGKTNLASVSQQKIITIHPGQRKEEVVEIFGKSLGWNAEQKKEFITPAEGSELPLKEGSFFPGTYIVSSNSTPSEVQNLINKRFITNILSRYSASTSERIPIEIALTIASLIQRETMGTDDMRLVSGIIWNRVFEDMNLQLDATLQYAKASNRKSAPWWPQVNPNDKYIRSPYNTYINNGLPPSPIANPSVAAVLAALNPVKTDCKFYFHDDNGDMHCTPNYEEHVALLKEKYGRGR